MYRFPFVEKDKLFEKWDEANLWSNLDVLTGRDALKFVIGDRADYDWAVARLAERPAPPCTVFFSPSHAQLPPGLLADWILADRLPVRLQVQLHKLLWGPTARGV